jgi:hypothetical protein
MSKGSRPRPYSVNRDEFSKRWDEVFKKDSDKMREKHPYKRPPKLDPEDFYDDEDDDGFADER